MQIRESLKKKKKITLFTLELKKEKIYMALWFMMNTRSYDA